MTHLVGQVLLDRYRIESFIGRGGMAEVYKAWDNRRSYYVALKVLQQDLWRSARFIQGFRDEALLLRELRHPHIVRYYDFEETGDLAFLIIDYVEGESLRSKLTGLEKPLSLGQVLSILEPVCIALHFAHEENVVHCDVKPANILIKKDGQVLLSDFGIARWTQAVTQDQWGAGAPAYMSPEQCSQGPISRQTDIYALGLTAYEMLTLDRPFRGNTTATPGSAAERILWEQMHQAPPQPTARNPAITAETERTLLRALAKAPKDRQPTALVFLQELSNQGRVQPDRQAQWPARKVKPVPKPPAPGPPPPKQAPPTSQTVSETSVWQRLGFKPTPAPPHVSRGQLLVLWGESPGQVYPIGTEEVRLGRAADNHIRLYVGSVSRRHAVIRYGNGRWFIQDQGSTHGTFVNGQQTDAVALNPGDHITIGETEFEFRVY